MAWRPILGWSLFGVLLLALLPTADQAGLIQRTWLFESDQRLSAVQAGVDAALVGISTDQPGQALFPFAPLLPGQQVQAPLAVQNVGQLPFRYSLTVEGARTLLGQDPRNGLQLEVLRPATGEVVYRGPLAVQGWPLGNLHPGEVDRLVLRISLPEAAGNAFQGLAETVDFMLHAESEGTPTATASATPFASPSPTATATPSPNPPDWQAGTPTPNPPDWQAGTPTPVARVFLPVVLKNVQMGSW